MVALAARQGGGKSTLAAELVRRGGTLFADDIVALAGSDEGVVGHPGPAIMNLPYAVDPASVGATEVLAEFGEERWVALPERPAAATAPAPLAAVVMVSRAAGLGLRCRPVPATALTLLPFAVFLPHMADRARQRFERFGRLAESTQLLELTCDPQTPVADMAEAVERQVGL